ncbi:hypothetical protein [Paraburkholderia sp. XV]|uniref:hypothetical protein n=1 Tax=Paraburkholderia sp. XV TaxID=2831520 RepID=UPI001CD44F6E|nr:hypothetical protein [Paraburkholderia sp. XV]
MNKDVLHTPLFPLGRTFATPGALELMQRTGTTPWVLLGRHRSGDFGCLDAYDCAANHRAVLDGTRILSAYELGPANEKIWVITEADRSSTTILLPSDY